jgi:hypothetical protein
MALSVTTALTARIPPTDPTDPIVETPKVRVAVQAGVSVG